MNKTDVTRNRIEWVTWFNERLGFDRCPECSGLPNECLCWMCDRHDVVTSEDECTECEIPPVVVASR